MSYRRKTLYRNASIFNRNRRRRHGNPAFNLPRECFEQLDISIGSSCVYLFLCILQSSTPYNVVSIIILLIIILIAGDVERCPGLDFNHHNTTDFTIFHLNIRSLRNKLGSITDMISQFDVICFIETHLDKSDSNSSLLSGRYHAPQWKDRDCFVRGIAVYFSSVISCRRRDDLEIFVCEEMWLQYTKIFKNISSRENQSALNPPLKKILLEIILDIIHYCLSCVWVSGP